MDIGLKEIIIVAAVIAVIYTIIKPKKVKAYLQRNKGLMVMIFLLLAARWSVVDHYRVPTGSMLETIQLGDSILVNKTAYFIKLPFTNYRMVEFEKPKRGDIIVFEYPGNRAINYVKRLVGLPGDKLLIRNGFLWVNGELTAEQSAYDSFYKNLEKQDIFYYQEKIGDQDVRIRRMSYQILPMDVEIEIPEGKYFVMGDNRDGSADSRSWGYVPEDHLIGKANRVLINLNFSEMFSGTFRWNRIGKDLYND